MVLECNVLRVCCMLFVVWGVLIAVGCRCALFVVCCVISRLRVVRCAVVAVSGSLLVAC